MQVGKPPAAGAIRERGLKPTQFRKFYERGDFPVAVEHDAKGNKIAWKVLYSPLLSSFRSILCIRNLWAK